MSLPYRVILVPWESYATPIGAIRTRVFVQEQRVPAELEWDGEDPHAVHALAFAASGLAIGTGRLLASGQIGRMAVLPEHRRLGVGGAILERLLAHARRRGDAGVFLHAQLPALSFYADHGFVAEGPDFTEAGIRHRRMRHSLDAT